MLKPQVTKILALNKDNCKFNLFYHSEDKVSHWNLYQKNLKRKINTDAHTYFLVEDLFHEKGLRMKDSPETSLKVLFQSSSTLPCVWGFLLLIEVNFLAYQFAAHVGKIDSLSDSRECWKWHCSITGCLHFYHHKSNYKHRGNLAGIWLREISIRLIRRPKQRW